MAVRAKFMCNMWRIRAKEEAKVMAIRGRGKKRRKRSLKGNHGTTHNGVMSATRVVSKKTTTKYYNCRDLCGGKYVPVFNWISLTLGPISLSWDLVSNIFPISIIANKFVVKKKIYIYIHVHNICDVDNLSGWMYIGTLEEIACKRERWKSNGGEKHFFFIFSIRWKSPWRDCTRHPLYTIGNPRDAYYLYWTCHDCLIFIRNIDSRVCRCSKLIVVIEDGWTSWRWIKKVSIYSAQSNNVYTGICIQSCANWNNLVQR